MYDDLKKRIIYAKHLKVTHDLKDNERLIVYYLYSQLIYGIENNKFKDPSRSTMSARIDFFNIRVEGSLIHIDTIYRNSQGIKAFRCDSKAEVEKIVETIGGAVQIIGLKIEKISKFSKFEYRIYIQL